MAHKSEQFKLGENVTSLAGSKTQKGTMVLSVRISQGEYAALEALGYRVGKIASQVAREAIREYVNSNWSMQPSVTISTRDFTTVTGAPAVTTEALATQNVPWNDLAETPA